MACLFRQISIMLLLTFGAIISVVYSQQLSSNKDYHVVIISIDGFPSEALWDERIPLPVIRSLAEEGAWSDEMIPSSPSVTWPNHTTLVTGVHPEKHGVLTNGLFIRDEGGPIYRENDVDRSELSDYPTLYDIAFKEGLQTAEVNWPVTRNSQTLHYSFPDAVDPVTHATPRLRAELVELKILEDETEEAFQLGSVRQDDVRTKIAIHLIHSQAPNLLLFHFLNADGTHHRYGAHSNAGFTSLALIDTQIQKILYALEEAGVRDQTTVFVVSDHGFMNVTKQIHPNVLLRQNGLLDVDDSGNITSARVQVLYNGGTAMVFSRNSATKENDLKKAQILFEKSEGIVRVLAPDEYGSFGMPHPSENMNMGDLVLAADKGYTFHNGATGDDAIVSLDAVYGSHGHLNDAAEVKTIFIASGRGIRSGIVLEEVDNRSVAPTAARLLGLTLETADGHALNEILKE